MSGIQIFEDKRIRKCKNVINNNEYLCYPRAIITALTYQTLYLIDNLVTTRLYA